MNSFELKRLPNRTNDDLIAEIRRVASLAPEGPLTLPFFNKHSKVHSTTLRTRFGGWKQALEAAGLRHRFNSTNAPLTREKIIAEMQRAAARLGKPTLTKRELYESSTSCARAIAREFSTWDEALEVAGLERDILSKRHTDEECYENLLEVWTHYGRAPQYKEMRFPPSRISPKAYIRRWGTWLKALAAFVERANQDTTAPSAPKAQNVDSVLSVNQAKRTPRDIPLGIRYKVLLRDGNRCLLCGRGPRSEPPAEIHVITKSRGPWGAKLFSTICGFSAVSAILAKAHVATKSNFKCNGPPSAAVDY